MTTPAQPNLKFLLAHPAHFLALGFGIGLIKKAPGTWGSLIALPLFCLVAPYSIPTQYSILTLLFMVGVYCCELTGKHLGIADYRGIVWDEIVAMLWILTTLPKDTAPPYLWGAIAFLLFRLFDIWKPFPIRQCDMKIKGGLGVMLDDLLAAVYTILSLKALQWTLLTF